MFGYPVSFKRRRLYELFLYLSTGQYKSDFTKIAGFNGKLLRTIIEFVPLEQPNDPFKHSCYLHFKWDDRDELQLSTPKNKKSKRKLAYTHLAMRTKAKQICPRA